MLNIPYMNAKFIMRVYKKNKRMLPLQRRGVFESEQTCQKELSPE